MAICNKSNNPRQNLNPQFVRLCFFYETISLLPIIPPLCVDKIIEAIVPANKLIAPAY